MYGFHTINKITMNRINTMNPHNGFFNFLLSLLAISVVVLSCSKKGVQIDDSFSVTMTQVVPLAARAYHYHLDKNEIKVVLEDLFEEAADSIIYKKFLTDKDKKDVQNFFSDFPLADLEAKYLGRTNFTDLDEKYFVFESTGQKKEIFVYDFYQNDLGGLVMFLNSLVDEQHKITYMDRKRKSK